MRKAIGIRWAVIAAGAAMLLVLAAACGAETIEVPGETIVVEKEVIREVEVPGETVVVEKEVIREVEVPGETVVVEKEVVKEVEVPGETVVVEKEVVKEVEVPGETVYLKEVKEVVVVATPVPAGEAQFLLTATEPFPKYGGTLRIMGIINVNHFDIHQSATIRNTMLQSPMYDTLIEWDPRDGGKSIIPSIAHNWELGGGGTEYTFFIRDNVMFHDGAQLTSADVKATYDKIVFPNEGIASIRQGMFNSITSIDAQDDWTLRFTLSSPRSSNYMFSAFAAPWNYIVQKSVLDENNQDLKKIDNYPGTGPFVYRERRPDEFMKTDKNANYWNPSLPYVDGIDYFQWPSSVLGIAQLEAGTIDILDATSKAGIERLQKVPGIVTNTFQQVSATFIWFNAQVPPFDDQRVRRAAFLAIDKTALENIFKVDQYKFMGGYVYPETPDGYSAYGTDFDIRPGYRTGEGRAEDLAEAKRLVAEVHPNGWKEPLDFLVRGLQEGSYEITLAQAVQQMFVQDFGWTMEIRRTDPSKWIEDAREGKFTMTAGNIVSVTDDPSDYFRDWYVGASNYSNWKNEEFVALLDKIDSELDDMKRADLVFQAELLLEADPPGMVPINWHYNSAAWRDYVKYAGRAFSHYNLARWQIVWLDK